MALSCLHDAPVYLIPPLLGFLAFFSLGLLSFLRSRRNQTNLYFASICLMGAALNLDVALVSLVGSSETALLIDRCFYMMFVFSIPLYVLFTHSFLGMTSKKHIEKSAVFASLFFLLLVPTDLFIPYMREYTFGRIAQAGPAFNAFSLIGGIAVFYCLVALFRGLSKARDNEERCRVKYVLTGLGLSAVLILMSHISVSGADLYPIGSFSFIPALMLSVGILKYDLIGLDVAIRKGILYFLLTVIITFSYLLIIYLAQSLFSTSASDSSPLTPLLLALVIAVLFQPLRERVQAVIDRLFFKGKYDYQAVLKRISRELGTLRNVKAIKEFLMNSLNCALRVSAISLLTFENGGTCASPRDGSTSTEAGPAQPVAQILLDRKTYLSRAALRNFPGPQESALRDFFNINKASLLVPVISGERLAGILCLGDKESGELFVHEDLELLMTAANQAAIAIDNAGVYSRLEEMNRDLERRVEERTGDLVRALHEKEAAQQQLIQSESLAAIGQLVAGTAHELNNPLAGASSLVQSSLEYLESKPGKDSGDAELIADLEFSLKELTRARDIIKSLLGVSRQTSTLMERVDVNAVIRDSLLVLHNQYKSRILRIDTDFGDVPAVAGNFGSLGQVMMNVIKNAIEAVPPGTGVIGITTAFRGGAVVVECSDNGPGITEGAKKDIFKPFFTTKEVGKGTGLGLYISHEIVKRHGGSIHAGDRAGGGAMFRIEIPEETSLCRDY